MTPPSHSSLGHLDGRRSVRGLDARLDVDSDTIGTIDVPREHEAAE